jgi:hypothetical protein
MSAAANNGGARSAHMIVAGLSFTVAQGAAGTTPPPAPPQTVQLSGTLSGLLGQCPTISFTVNSTSVFAVSSTAYSGGKCADLRNGRAVTVTGTVQADSRVLATLIALGK